MPAAAQHTSRFKVEVDGTPVPDTVDSCLLSAFVDNAVNLPDLFVLVYRDQHRDILDNGKFKVGSTVVVKVYHPDLPEGEKLVNGEVTALEVDINTQGTFTVVRGLDKSHRLFRGRYTMNYEGVRYSDIAQQVAGRLGLDVAQIDSTDTVHPHVTQANCTDWIFLQGLASEVGFEMGVVDGQFVFRQPQNSDTAPAEGTLQSPDPLQLILGANLIRCRTTITAADQVSKVEVRGWDSDTKKALVSQKTLDTDTLSLGTTSAELAATFPDSTFVAVDVPYITQADVEAASTALKSTVASSFAEMDGLAHGNPKLKAGTSVSLGLVKAPFDGKYTVTTTRHSYDPDEGYTTSFGVTGASDRTLHGLMVGGPGGWDGPSNGPISGVVTALVTDVRDPNNNGRVKVQFPWLNDTYVSDWVRLLQAGAGDKRGWAILPEVGDEVLLAFDHGDVRRPFLLGGLYNGIDNPHDSVTGDWIDGTTGAVNIRSFTSRTGHRLDFVDKSGGEQVHLTTGDSGYQLTLDQQGTKITMQSNGTIEITAQQDITIKSTMGNVEISGMQVKISGSTGVDIDGGPTTTVTGGIVKINS